MLRRSRCHTALFQRNNSTTTILSSTLSCCQSSHQHNINFQSPPVTMAMTEQFRNFHNRNPAAPSHIPAAVAMIIPRKNERALSDHAKHSAIGSAPEEPVSPLGTAVEEIIYNLSCLQSTQGTEMPSWIPLQRITREMSDAQLEELDGYFGGLKNLIQRQLTERVVLVHDSKSKTFKVRYVAIQPQLIKLMNIITPAVVEAGMYRDIKDFGIVSARVEDPLKTWCDRVHGNLIKATSAAYRRIPNLPFRMEKKKNSTPTMIRFSLKRDHHVVQAAIRDAGERATKNAQEFSQLMQQKKQKLSGEDLWTATTTTTATESTTKNVHGNDEDDNIKSNEKESPSSRIWAHSTLAKPGDSLQPRNNDFPKYNAISEKYEPTTADQQNFKHKASLIGEKPTEEAVETAFKKSISWGNTKTPFSSRGSGVSDLLREVNSTRDERSRGKFTFQGVPKHRHPMATGGVFLPGVDLLPEENNNSNNNNDQQDHGESENKNNNDVGDKRLPAAPVYDSNRTTNLYLHSAESKVERNRHISTFFTPTESTTEGEENQQQQQEVEKNQESTQQDMNKEETVQDPNAQNETKHISSSSQSSSASKGHNDTNDTVPTISFVNDALTSAAFVDEATISPKHLVPFIPAFFVPISELVKLLEPEGYTYAHLDHYFLRNSRVFQVISLGSKLHQKFIRCHGHSGDFDMTECLTVAAQREAYKKFEPKPEAAVPFLKVLADPNNRMRRENGDETNNNSNGVEDWMPLQKLLELAGSEAVEKLPRFFGDGKNEGDSTLRINEVDKNETVSSDNNTSSSSPVALDDEEVNFRRVSPLLYFSQLQHLFNFSASDGGLVCYVPPSRVSLSLQTSPCPALINHLFKGLYSQSIDTSHLETRLLPRLMLQQAQSLFPSWPALVQAHNTILHLDHRTRHISLKSVHERETLKETGTIEEQLEYAMRNRNLTQVVAIRRRLALAKSPMHPLGSSQGLADFLYALLPESGFLPLRTFSQDFVSMEVRDFLPKKGLFHIVSKFPNHFKVFDLYLDSQSLHEYLKNGGTLRGAGGMSLSSGGGGSTPCVCRAHIRIPDDAITQENLSERDLVKFIVRMVVHYTNFGGVNNNGSNNQHNFGSPRHSRFGSVLLDVILKKIPMSARLEITDAADLVALLRKLPNHFVMVAAYADNVEVKLVKIPDEEDYKIYSKKPLSRLDEFEPVYEGERRR